MKKKNLTKLYDRFTPEERLRLVIEALARGDEAEKARLITSCPYKTYTQTDVAFAIPLLAAHDLIQATCQDLDLARGALQMIQSFQLLTTELQQWSESKAEGAEGLFEEIREKLNGLSNELETNHRRETIMLLKRILEGLDHFCKSTFSLDSGTVLKAFAKPYWEWLEGLQDETATAEAAPAEVADYEKSLIEHWNIRIARAARISFR
jgi:hypothetical protein